MSCTLESKNSKRLLFACIVVLFILLVGLSTALATSESAITEDESNASNIESLEAQPTEPIEGNSKEMVAAVGSTLRWDIIQKVNTLGIDSITRYVSMSFEDVLPPEIEFDHAVLTGINNADITSHVGTISHDAATNTVRYIFNSSWLQYSMPLSGETYTFSIFGRIKSIPESGNITNRGLVYINNLLMNTNNTITPIKKAALSISMFTANEIITPNLSGKATVDFESTVAQVNYGAAARDVLIEDEMPSGLDYVCGSLEIKDKDNNIINAAITETPKGFTAKLDRLDYSEELNLDFKCETTADGLGKNLNNEIKATAFGVVEVKAQSPSFYVRNTVAPRTISVTSIVSKNDLRANHGDAIFVFVVNGKDVEGNSHTYRTLASLNETSQANSSGCATATCLIENVPAGEYTVSEIIPSRYLINSLDSPDEHVQINGESAEINLLSESYASCSFNNKKTSWSQLSDTSFEINSFPGGAK